MYKYPKERIGYHAALRYAKKAVGTNEVFFPNRRTMVTTWAIVAEVIEKAMGVAWRIGYWQGRKDGQALDEQVGLHEAKDESISTIDKLAK